ncbi:DUF2919 family protein [Paraglaciecola aquimarina]|uniref:DUF2919 family protein n=1 Tax=Paraglaciecola aquimarina TaxID=1235557 RepID=A0ABU3SZN2_9ALTE|nr:DUF2919 family protein [Paraglaciecola aquimarina]MDU0355474.1 DUF2919 family protein [Paraglaciecola aquimarina]
MKLLLPLKYYDDAGRVKPPVGLYLTALYLCRSIVVLIGAYSSKQYSNELISLFYGEQRYLYLSLMIALPALLSVTLIGFRENYGKPIKCGCFSG